MLEMRAIATHWWVVLLRGIAAILFGLAALFWPGIATLAFVFVFGAYAFVDGVFAVVAAFRMGGAGVERWWALLLAGLVGIAIGAVTLFSPDITWVALGILVAAWALATGFLE